jgi:long-chain acyl-CoA synthetase
MKGYWNLPEETAKRLKPGLIQNEKVLYTGDFFKMDEEGYLYFISRKDDIIKTAGEMVSPKEVENALYEMDSILEAAVVGVSDEVLGRAIKAVVVLKEGAKITDKDIISHCSKLLEPFKVPKLIEFRTSLPKTTTGKIKKTGL